MHDHSDHSGLMDTLLSEYGDLLNGSEQAMYIYLDDEHKACNKKFAELLGYSSEDEWSGVSGPFTDAFVDNLSQEKLVNSYQDAMENGKGSVVNIVWKKKDGVTVKSEVILVPIVHKGHLFALHFVTA